MEAGQLAFLIIRDVREALARELDFKAEGLLEQRNEFGAQQCQAIATHLRQRTSAESIETTGRDTMNQIMIMARASGHPVIGEQDLASFNAARRDLIESYLPWFEKIAKLGVCEGNIAGHIQTLTSDQSPYHRQEVLGFIKAIWGRLLEIFDIELGEGHTDVSAWLYRIMWERIEQFPNNPPA